MNTRTLNVFISYGRRDGRELALALSRDLQAAGCSVWLDTQEIPGGADWLQKIEVAIDHCDVTLALMSPASNDSQWCRAEQLRALRKSKRVIPLRATVDAECPLHLEHLNQLDFSNAGSYDAALRDLLSDITAGQAFAPVRPPTEGKSPYRRAKSGALDDEKRSAAAFRRELKALRRASWLGSRYWWPFFLFQYLPLEFAAEALMQGELLSPFLRGESLNTRWDKFVRLSFRPRTPEFYHAEGIQPARYASPEHVPVPVYFLFDFESLIVHPESRFSDGSIDLTGKTYKTPVYFRELPFEQIYHDSTFMPDEREEIMRCREAEVFVPERIGLETLQIVWLRSAAEYETLRALLPPEIWQQWRSKITTRTDYHLFNHRQLYVQQALLTPESVWLQFNPCRQSSAGTYELFLYVTAADGRVFRWYEADFNVKDALRVTLPESLTGYRARLEIDGHLAYEGQHLPGNILI